jgi:hypothetical protein
VVLAGADARRFLSALLVAALPTLLLGVAALPVYYFCRAAPLRWTGMGVPLRAHALLALLGGFGLWVALDLCARLGDWAAPRGLAGEVEARWLALPGVGALLYLVVAASFTLTVSAQRARASERRAAAASLRAHEAQLAQLKAQIHPHFLFNSLNAISALTVQDPRGARDLCVLLADFLRSSLRLGERGSVTLAEEVALARAYLDVERARLGERLAVDVQVSPEAGAVRIPALLLQPLVENAVTHGIATCAQGGTLALSAQVGPGGLVVTVTNPFDPQAPARRGRASGGVGLANVSRRVAACYQGASLTTRREVDRFTSTLVLPIAREEPTDGERAAAAQGPDRR